MSDATFTVDDLAQEIRRVDGNHSLGADAREALDLIHQAATPDGSQWQTMDTAPRDGTKFDAWDRDGRITDVYWSDVQEAFCTDGNYGPEEPSPLAFFPAPSHWMPLAAAPEGGK